MTDRKLARPVTFAGVTYAAGTAAADMPAEHVEGITNPKVWDTEAAAATGNVGTGPTPNFVSVENPLPRATAAKPADDKEPDAAPTPAATPAKAVPAKAAKAAAAPAAPRVD
jgi:hypothetical protein